MGNFQQTGLLRLISGQPNADPAQSCYSLPVTGETAIGRTTDCQIMIDSNLYGGVSRRHAVVRPLSGSLTPNGAPIWQVCDLNSANGTFINGQRIQGCHTLKVGDRITFSQNGPQFLFEYRSTQTVNVGASPSPTGRAASFPQPAYPAQPPLPIGSDSVTMSQLFPLMSARRDLFRKGYLVPGILTVFVVVSLFIFSNNLGIYTLLLALYLGGGGFYFIYRLCGKEKPWWLLFLSGFFTMVFLVIPPALGLFIWVFRRILPGNIDKAGSGFIPQLISHFSGQV